VQPHEEQVREALQALSLPWEVILNKGAVMTLPIGTSKRSGLERAVRDLGESLEQTVGVGDAENGRTFLDICGLSVAMANALDDLKATADLVTDGARGQGVAELLERWRTGQLDELGSARRRRRPS
jgi:hydroxymethylpyrimidine pyrophosphatase-like HAD family hydrolase